MHRPGLPLQHLIDDNPGPDVLRRDVRAFGFDLGNTLLEYSGIPLNWEQHYPAALRALAAALQLQPSADQFVKAGDVLRRYNTRLAPREFEVRFETILAEIGRCFDATPADELPSAAAFFGVFQQKLQPFADARPTLERLREQGCRTGVFTDVPYGMPTPLVHQDIAAAGLVGVFDVLVTSRDAGTRKPAAASLRTLADALGCVASEMVYIGDERKDVDAALRFGCAAVLLDRGRQNPDWGQDRTIASLLELCPN